MFYDDELDVLLKGMEHFGLHISRKEQENLYLFMQMVLEWNQKINLTAITERKEFIVKHFLDSLSILNFLPRDAHSLIDVGTGGGFPGIPLKIVKKDMNVTLLDSLQKRIRFLNEVIFHLKLHNISTLASRAEDAGNNEYFREKFDCCVSRAVAPFSVLCEFCLPLVKKGGLFIAMKTQKGLEIQESRTALEILGGKIISEQNFNLPGTNLSRKIILIKKFRQTPTKYPRKSGIPTKNPL